MAKKEKLTKEKEVKQFHTYISMHKRRTKKFYTDAKKHNYLLYNDETHPRAQYADNDVDAPPNINLYYADIETWRASINLSNPKVFITAKKNKFYIVHTKGEDLYMESDDEDHGAMFRQMEEQGQTEFNSLDGRYEYVILDGKASAKLIEHNVNHILREKKVENVVMRDLEDATIAGMGGLWIDFKTNGGVYRNETELLKNDDVTIEYVELEKIAIDPFVSNPYDVDKSRWVARCYEMLEEDLLDCKEDYISGSIDKYLEGQKEAVFDIETDNPEDKEMLEMLHKDNDKSNLFKTHRLWEIWEKPSMKDRKNGKPGRVKVIVEGHNEYLKNEEWSHSTDRFPLHLLWFNVANDRFYPTADVQMYESILNERNVARKNIRDKTFLDSSYKLLFDSAVAGDAEVNQLLKNDARAIPIDGFTKDKFMQLTPSSVAGEWYARDQHLNIDQERISRLSDVKKGFSKPGRQTATETYIEAQSANSGVMFRINILARFYRDIIGHIIDLIQQYYTIDRQIILTGGTSPEWTDKFSKKDIQGDYHIEIDVNSMSPQSDQIEQKQRLDLLNLSLGVLSNPLMNLKMVSEGKTLNLSEMISDLFDSMNIRDGKIFPKVHDNMWKAADIAYARALGLAPQVFGGEGAPQGGGGQPQGAMQPNMMSQGEPKLANALQGGATQMPSQPLQGGGGPLA